MCIFCTHFLVFLYLFGAAVSDQRTGKIPNRYLLLWFVLFFAEAAVRRNGISFLAGVIFISAVLFPLFFFRMMGAGDIKLMALLGGVFGIRQGSILLFFGLLCAAIWSVFYLMRKHMFLKRIGYFLNYVKQTAENAEEIWKGARPEPYFDAERDGREAAFCFAPFLLLGYLLWLLFSVG